MNTNSDVKEKTLCAWCGKPLDNNDVLYLGEYICVDCHRLNIKVKRKSLKFWKGVAKNVLRK